MKFTIYRTTNLVNQKVYIGKHQTKDPNDDYLGSGKLIDLAIRKYGRKNFKKEVLFIFDTEKEMNAKEKELITEEFCLQKDNYNLCVGGHGGFSHINRIGLNLYGLNGTSGYGLEGLFKGHKTLEQLRLDPSYNKQTKQKVLDGVKRYYQNGGKNGFKGKFHSEETKKKISEAAKRRCGLL